MDPLPGHSYYDLGAYAGDSPLHSMTGEETDYPMPIEYTEFPLSPSFTFSPESGTAQEPMWNGDAFHPQAYNVANMRARWRLNHGGQYRSQSMQDIAWYGSHPEPVPGGFYQDQPQPSEPTSPKSLVEKHIEEMPVSETSGATSKMKRSHRSSHAANNPTGPKRSKKSSQSYSALPPTPESDSQRQRYLERNRAAAAKCRLKNKSRTSRLADEERRAEEENTFLASQVTELREEVLSLKTEILRHSNCKFTLIDNYISDQAHQRYSGARESVSSNGNGSIQEDN